MGFLDFIFGKKKENKILNEAISEVHRGWAEEELEKGNVDGAIVHACESLKYNNKNYNSAMVLEDALKKYDDKESLHRTKVFREESVIDGGDPLINVGNPGILGDIFLDDYEKAEYRENNRRICNAYLHEAEKIKDKNPEIARKYLNEAEKLCPDPFDYGYTINSLKSEIEEKLGNKELAEKHGKIADKIIENHLEKIL